MLYSAMATKSLERKIDTLTAIIRLGSTAEMRTGVWFAVARGTPNPIGSTQPFVGKYRRLGRGSAVRVARTLKP
jgi:hypothetical protein